MEKPKNHGYYRKDRDFFLWQAFDELVIRLRTNKSAALTEAAREWVQAHKDDPTPRRGGDVAGPDPFA